MATTKRKTPAKKTARKSAAKKNGVAKGRKPRKGQKVHPRKLRGQLLHEFRASALELELKRQKLENVGAKLNALSRDTIHDPVFLLLAKKEALVKEIKTQVFAFAEVQKKIAKKFDIPFENIHEYTFDTNHRYG